MKKTVGDYMERYERVKRAAEKKGSRPSYTYRWARRLTAKIKRRRDAHKSG